MKKSKILNIMLTSVMLLSTILTPQMAHALASMQDDGIEDITELEQTDTDAISEDPVGEANDGAGEGDSAVVTAIEGEVAPEEGEDETPVVEEETEDDKQDNPDNTGPPMGIQAAN